MTRVKVNGRLLIEEEPSGTCELCGKEAETRPYGPGGKEICFSCGKLNKAERDRRFRALL